MAEISRVTKTITAAVRQLNKDLWPHGQGEAIRLDPGSAADVEALVGLNRALLDMARVVSALTQDASLAAAEGAREDFEPTIPRMVAVSGELESLGALMDFWRAEMHRVNHGLVIFARELADQTEGDDGEGMVASVLDGQ
jgi:hypothetical protein